MNTLRSQMQADMVLRGLAPRTQQHYIAAVMGLAAHYHKSPDALCQDEVQRYLLHLIEERKLARSGVAVYLVTEDLCVSVLIDFYTRWT